MALKTYKWNGSTWQIDDKDLHRYPGAVLVEKEEKKEKQKEDPANKSGKAPKTK